MRRKALWPSERNGNRNGVMSSEVSDLRCQISDTVIASEERARQSHGFDGDYCQGNENASLSCFGLRPRNDVGYGAPALGIGASYRVARKARPAG